MHQHHASKVGYTHLTCLWIICVHIYCTRRDLQSLINCALLLTSVSLFLYLCRYFEIPMASMTQSGAVSILDCCAVLLEDDWKFEFYEVRFY